MASNASSTPPSEDDKSASSRTDKDNTMTLKSTIKSVVVATNDVLGRMEETTDTITKPIVSKLGILAKQARHYGQRTYRGYQGRREYGPQIVAGSTVLLGGLTAARRGRFPGAIAALMAGSLSYAFVYNDVETVFDVPKNE